MVYGALPFDGEGYCCQHPSVRIAKKKAMGGWEVSHINSCVFFLSFQTNIRISRRKMNRTGDMWIRTYWGYVDKDYRPNGQGVMKYEDGTEWEGVWCEGSQVNGKLKKAKGKSAKSKF